MPKPDVIAFSGSVAEYVFGRESADHGDLGRWIAVEGLRLRRYRRGDPADKCRAIDHKVAAVFRPRRGNGRSF